MNNELRDKAIAHLRDARRHFAQQQEAKPVVEVGEGQILQWAPPYKRYPVGTKFYLHPPKPAAQPADIDADELSNFIRKIDGNHSMGAGALAENIVEWLEKQAPLPQVPEGGPPDIEVREAVAAFMKDTQTLPLEDCAKLLVMRIKALLAASKSGKGGVMGIPSEAAKKWFWMMQFCKDVGVSPSDPYWWDKAEREYYEHLKKTAAKDEL